MAYVFEDEQGTAAPESRYVFEDEQSAPESSGLMDIAKSGYQSITGNREIKQGVDQINDLNDPEFSDLTKGYDDSSSFMGTSADKLRRKTKAATGQKGLLLNEAQRSLDSGQSRMEKAGQAKLSPETEKFLNDESEDSWVSDFLDAPWTIVTEIGAQSAYGSLESLATGIAAGAATGPVGLAIGSGAGSARVEFANSFIETLRENDVDLTSADSIQKALADSPDLYKHATQKAMVRSGIIGTADGITMGFASKSLGVGKGLTNQATNMVAQGVVQMGGGAGGEASAQLATEGEITSPRQIAAEAVGELVTAPIDVGVAGYTAAKNRGNASEDVLPEDQPQDIPPIDPVAAGVQANFNDLEAFKGEISAKAMGLKMPEQTDYSQYDQPTVSRGAESGATGLNEIDQMIRSAEKLGFENESVRLETAKRHFANAELARSQGDHHTASRYTELGNGIVQDVMGQPVDTNQQAQQHSDQLPTPYVSQGQVEGGDVAATEQPDNKGNTFDAEQAPGRLPQDQQARIESQGQKNRLGDEGIIYGEEPEGRKEQRQQESQQREADNFSAMYGQEGNTPYREQAKEGEFVPKGVLREQAKLENNSSKQLPPGTGQINAGKDKPNRTFTPTNPLHEAVGRNVVERQANTPDALPNGSKAGSMSADEFAALQKNYHKARTIPASKRTPEQKQVISDYQEVKQDKASLKPTAEEIAQAAAETNTSPTESQIEADNYRKGRVKIAGLNIAIENPKGSIRKGVDESGRAWESKIKHHYGDIKGVKGADGDDIDVFIGDNPESEQVFIVDQIDAKTGAFDEHKVMVGFHTLEEAKEGYLANYEKNWGGLGEIKALPEEDFKQWLKTDTTKPYAYQNNKTATKEPSVFSSTPSGTLKIKGVTKDLASKLSAVGIKSAPRKDGVSVSAKFAEKARQEIPVKVEHINGATIETFENGNSWLDDNNGSRSQGNRDQLLDDYNATRGQKEAQAAKATKEKSSKAAAKYKAEPNPDKHDLLQAISMLGGIGREHAEGVDPADFTRRGHGIKYVFPKNNGRSIDEMAEALEQYGYVAGSNRHGELQDKIDRALRGEPVNSQWKNPEPDQSYTEEDHQERELSAFEKARGAEHVTEYIASDGVNIEELAMAELALREGMSPEQAIIAVQYSELPIDFALGAMGINDGQSQGATSSRFDEENAKRGNEAQTPGADRPREAGSNSEASSDQEPLLTSYSESDLTEREAKAKATAAAKAKADTAAKAKQDADNEAATFSLAGSDRATDVAASQGQSDIFGAPTKAELKQDALKDGVDADVLDRLESSVIDAQDRVDRLNRKFDEAHKQNADLPGWTVTGRDNRSKSLDKRINAATSKQDAIFRDLEEAKKDVKSAQQKAAGYKSGRAHENGQPKSTIAADNKINLTYAEYIQSKVKAGDMLWFTQNPHAVKVKRLNKNTVTLDSGSKWDYLSFVPMVDGRGMTQAELKADMLKANTVATPTKEAKPLPVSNEIDDTLAAVPADIDDSGITIIPEDYVKELGAKDLKDGSYPLGYHNAISTAGRNGELSLEDFKHGLDTLLDNETEVKQRLNKYKKAVLMNISGRMYFSANDYTKPQVLEHAWQRMVGFYLLDKNPTQESAYDPFTMTDEKRAKRKADKAAEIVELAYSNNQSDIDAWAKGFEEHKAEQAKKKIAKDKALDNPETLEEYQTFISENSEQDLSGEQLAKFDELMTRKILDRQVQQLEKKAEVAAIAGDTSFETIETTHAKKGIDLFVVKLTGDRVDKDRFNELRVKAKQLGGYYSGFARNGAIPGFQFESTEDRQRFINVLQGENESSIDKVEERLGKKQDARVAKLLGMADKAEERGLSKLNQDRKTNTARRASMAASSEAQAEGEVQFARLLKEISKATENGELEILSNLSAATQLLELNHIQNRLLWKADDSLIERENLGYRRWKKGISIDDKIKAAELPKPMMYVSVLSDAAKAMSEVSGYKQIAKSIQSRVKGKSSDSRVDLSHYQWERLLPKIKQFATRPGGTYNNHGQYYAERIREEVLSFNRLENLGISSLPMLRQALRELYRMDQRVSSPVAEKTNLQKLEQSLQMTVLNNRKAFNDFFPTPADKAGEIVDLADIGEGMEVLEPSAGNGMLADAAREAGGTVDVVEMGGALREILAEKGHNIVEHDFLDFEPSKQYDRIVMNPPFSNDQDIDHVSKAYGMLKPGGRMVAIVSSMTGDRSNKKNKAFRKWLDDLSADEQPLPEGAFKSSLNPTGVNTKVLVIDKPASEVIEPPKFSRSTSEKPKISAKKSSDQSYAKLLNDTLSSYFNNSWREAFEQSELPNSLAGFEQAVKAAFGVRVVGISNTEDKFDVFAGIHINDGRKAVYVNVNREPKFVGIAGHEIFHNLRRSRPDLFKYLVTHARNHFKNVEAYRNLLDAKLEEGQDLHTNSEIEEELLADFMGDALIDPDFLQLLAKDNPSKFKRLLNAVVLYLGKVKNRLKGLGSEQYFDDVEGLRKHLRGVLNAFADGKDLGKVKAPTMSSEQVNFSKDDEVNREQYVKAYHGSDDADFEVFDLDMFGENYGTQGEPAVYTTTSKDDAGYYGGEVKEVYINTSSYENINMLSLLKETYDSFESYQDQPFSEWVDSLNHDELINVLYFDNIIGNYATAAKDAGKKGVVADFTGTNSGDVILTFDIDTISDTNKPSFSRATNEPTAEAFAIPEETLVSAGIRKIADKFKVLKDLQKNITATGAEIDEVADAYMAEELFHGKAENDIRQMRETYVEPMAKKMAEFGITQVQLDEYLYAKHAPERNAHIAEINPDMPEGGSGMTDAKAAEIISNVELSGKANQYDQITSIVYDMLAARRDTIRAAGLEDNAMIDSWESSYEHYVPLKGYAEDEKQEGMPGTGKGFTIGGRESRRALGRESEAASPSSNAMSDLTETLIRKRKNEVGGAFLNLAEANPNKEYWQIFTDANPETDRRITKRKNPETGEVEETVQETPIPMAMMSDRYFTTKRDGVTHYIKLEDPRLMKAMKNIGPDTSNFFIQGLSKVNRFLSTVNTSYNPEFVVGNFARDIQTAALNLSAEQSRDDGKAAGVKIVKQTMKDVPKAMKAVYRALRGKDANNPEWANYFAEFQADGAKTGYFDMKDIDGQAADVQRLVDIANGGFKGGFYKWSQASAKLVEDVNMSVENAVRLSAYVNARKAGISRAKSASLAKNMTVNFNRRGEMGTTLNALYMFANASIQGSMNFARTMIGLKGEQGDPIWSRLNTAQKISIGLMAGSYALAVANRAGAGDDDDGENWYDKIPQYVKERNLVIMKSMLGGEQDGTYYKIPLPYGYNIFHVFGTSTESVTNGKTSIGQGATDLTLAALGSFSPIGFQASQSATGTILKNLTPTIGKPIVDVAMNENFMGSSIYNENFPFGAPKPDSSLSRRSTPEGYKAIAEFMNEQTGGSQWRSGSIDINPDVMRYFVDFALGGMGKFAFSKAPDNVYNVANGVEQPIHRTIFMSRLNGKVLPYEDQSKFYDRRDEIKQIESEFKGTTGPGKMQFYKENKQKLGLRGLIKATEKKLKVLRKLRNAVYSSNLTPRQRDNKLKAIEERMKVVVDRFNRSYNAAD